MPQLQLKHSTSSQRLLGKHDKRCCGVCPLAFQNCSKISALLMPSTADSTRITAYSPMWGSTRTSPKSKQRSQHLHEVSTAHSRLAHQMQANRQKPSSSRLLKRNTGSRMNCNQLSKTLDVEQQRQSYAAYGQSERQRSAEARTAPPSPAHVLGQHLI